MAKKGLSLKDMVKKMRSEQNKEVSVLKDVKPTKIKKAKPKPAPKIESKPAAKKAEKEDKAKAEEAAKAEALAREAAEKAAPAKIETVAPKTVAEEILPPKAAKEEKPMVEALEKAEKKKITAYGNVKVYQLKGHELLHYEVPVPRPTASEKAIIMTLKEAATRLISVAPYRIRDPEQRRNVYFNQIMEILESSGELNIPHGAYSFYANAVVREMVGYGLIDDLIKDDRLEEIMVIGPLKPVYVFHRDYGMMTTNIQFYNDQEIQDLINRIARGVGRRVDISSPLLDARLPDGSRVNATIAPASVAGSTLTIRKFRSDPLSIIDMVTFGTLNVETAAFLWLAVDGMEVRPANILIAGGTGSGKTTTLNVLSSFIPDKERVISIEDTAELNLPLKHWVRFEAKPPGLEGKGELTMDILTKNSLRMRPDRIVVGEIRHAEAFTLFTAMNTGHDGCMGTIHANSADETMVRVVSPPMNVPELMLAGLDFIIIQHRLHDRFKGTVRRITEIAEVSGILKGKPAVKTIFKWQASKDKLIRTKEAIAYLDEIADLTGLSKKQVMNELKKREKILKELTKKKIRSMAEVAEAMNTYRSRK